LAIHFAGRSAPIETLMGASGTAVSSVRFWRNAARYTIGFHAEPGCRNEPVTRFKSE